MGHGLATHHKGTLGFVTTDFFSEVAQRIHTGIQAPGIADGAKGMGGHDVHTRFLSNCPPLNLQVCQPRRLPLEAE